MKKNNKYNILIIEDEKDIAETYKDCLGYLDIFNSIILSSNSKDALLKIQNQRFDLFIVDINLPYKKGDDFLDSMIHSKKIDPSKVIICSGEISKELFDKLYNMKIKKILAKPTTVSNILNSVKKVLNVVD